MTHPMISEALMRDHQRQVEQEAAHYSTRHPRPRGSRVAWRTGAGRILVRAGVRLARVDSSPVALQHLVAG